MFLLIFILLALFKHSNLFYFITFDMYLPPIREGSNVRKSLTFYCLPQQSMIHLNLTCLWQSPLDPQPVPFTASQLATICTQSNSLAEALQKHPSLSETTQLCHGLAVSPTTFTQCWPGAATPLGFKARWIKAWLTKSCRVSASILLCYSPIH